MNTTYDVLRFILGCLRHVASEQDIAQALAIIEQQESGTAQSQSPDVTPADGLPQQGGF